MALVCVASVRGSPGATTLGVLLGGSWPRPVVLVEADPDGGVLAARCGLAREPGLAGLAAQMHGPATAEGLVWEHAQRLVGGLAAVVAHESSDITSATLRAVGGRLGSWCASQNGFDVIADVGRLRAGSPALAVAGAADALLVVVRPKPDELYAALPRLDAVTALSSQGHKVSGLVLVGEDPYGPDEVRSQLDVPVVGVIAEDPKAAGVLWEGGRFRRLALSALARNVKSLTDEITTDLGVTVPGPDPDAAQKTVAASKSWSNDELAARLRAGARVAGSDGSGPEAAR